MFVLPLMWCMTMSVVVDDPAPPVPGVLALPSSPVTRDVPLVDEWTASSSAAAAGCVAGLCDGPFLVAGMAAILAVLPVNAVTNPWRDDGLSDALVWSAAFALLGVGIAASPLIGWLEVWLVDLLRAEDHDKGPSMWAALAIASGGVVVISAAAAAAAAWDGERVGLVVATGSLLTVAALAVGPLLVLPPADTH